jgi:hypothetical protein
MNESKTYFLRTVKTATDAVHCNYYECADNRLIGQSCIFLIPGVSVCTYVKQIAMLF